MDTKISFASIRMADLSASEAWEMLGPIVEKADSKVAAQVCDALRQWAWKALDRRRRDAELREWIDVLNRVEAFFVDRFEAVAAKIELLSELIHESVAVTELAEPQELLRRKHVARILSELAAREGAWVQRTALMDSLDIKPANMTRLMTLLLDMGWAEQLVDGREVRYRAAAEGLTQAQNLEPWQLKAAEKAAELWSSQIKIRAYSHYFHHSVRLPSQKKHRRSSPREEKVQGVHDKDLLVLLGAESDDHEDYYIDIDTSLAPPPVKIEQRVPA